MRGNVIRPIVSDARRFAELAKPSTPPLPNNFTTAPYLTDVAKFLLWCILFVLCWPLALLALVLYPLVWILLIPFRVVGIAVDGVLGLVRGVVMLPGRVLRGPRHV